MNAPSSSLLSVRIVREEEHTAWDAFLHASSHGSFLQSWEWGTFQERAGFAIHRVVVEEADGTWEAVCLLVMRPLPFQTSYIYAPWGPVLRERHTAPTEEILAALRQYVAHALNPTFFRIEPKWERGSSEFDAFTQLHTFPVGRTIQPQDTLVLSLHHSEDELLRAMHPKTRYNIRVAARHSVLVEEETSPEGIHAFLRLARQIEKRGKFHYHSDAYYETMHTVLSESLLSVRVARHNNDILAAALFLRCGDTLTYAHGASSFHGTQLMGSHALHWETILWAKAQGLLFYDFFGVAPDGATITHPWQGISRFKRGFGGREYHFAGSRDVVYDPLRYRLMNIARGLRGIVSV